MALWQGVCGGIEHSTTETVSDELAARLPERWEPITASGSSMGVQFFRRGRQLLCLMDGGGSDNLLMAAPTLKEYDAMERAYNAEFIVLQREKNS